LPLAIELAARRIKILPPDEMLGRLAHQLDVLTGGPADSPARQQTLRDAIAWSYDLLPPDARALTRRLAVFADACTLESVEEICTVSPALSAVDGISTLVDSSLLQRLDPSGGDARFRMLAAIRQYAAERLDAAGEGERIRRAHAQYFLALAERAERGILGSLQRHWLDRLDQAHDDLRLALEWLVQTDVPAALRLGGLLGRFWYQSGYLTDGLRRLTGPARPPFRRRFDACARMRAVLGGPPGQPAGGQRHRMPPLPAKHRHLPRAR
jgi:predicted ATPase